MTRYFASILEWQAVESKASRHAKGHPSSGLIIANRQIYGVREDTYAAMFSMSSVVVPRKESFSKGLK